MNLLSGMQEIRKTFILNQLTFSIQKKLTLIITIQVLDSDFTGTNCKYPGSCVEIGRP